MLLSMTGFGAASSRDDRLHVTVEVRTVNNRYFKISSRYPEAYAPLESEIEKTVRDTITRGTVTATLRVNRLGETGDYQLDQRILTTYWNQLNQWTDGVGLTPPQDPSGLLLLPGVVREESFESVDCTEDWPLIQDALTQAMQNLQEFRINEGRSIEVDLRSNCEQVTEQIEKVSELAPQVVVDYRDRLLERVRELLTDAEASIDSDGLIREVSVFADKCDINEEITRLRCHLEQFAVFLTEKSSMGRKLEFLSQEMFREVNTIGSKANNVSISHCVVEMKAAVERIRENLQNVE